MIGVLITATAIGISGALWPGHLVLVFAIVVIAYSAFIQLVIVKREDRKLMRMLCINVVVILCLAIVMHFIGR